MPDDRKSKRSAIDLSGGILCGRCGASLGSHLTNGTVVSTDAGMVLRTTEHSQIHNGEQSGRASYFHRCPTPGWVLQSDDPEAR